MQSFHTVIIGGGVIGMAIARGLAQRWPERSIALIDKEHELAQHTSSRNSGVLHAGFYYTSDSLKAKLTAQGNAAWRVFCKNHDLVINTCGKLVVARNDFEVEQLKLLEARGKQNGSQVELLTSTQVEAIDPNVVTHRFALWSPLTATVDPVQCCMALEKEIKKLGVHVFKNTAYLKRLTRTSILTTQGELEAQRFINAAGLYADRIAKDFNLGERYTIIPFKGKYIEYEGQPETFRVNVYPVPDLRNPFLGVHFTKKSSGRLKIGPTATPAFWREHYGGLKNFSLRDFFQILGFQIRMFFKNANHFRSIAWEELKKINRHTLIRSACVYARSIDPNRFGHYGKPGIRAQLIDRKTLKLIQDFVVEADLNSIHILNAISPGFTCAFPFAEYVIDRYYEPQEKTEPSLGAQA